MSARASIHSCSNPSKSPRIKRFRPKFTSIGALTGSVLSLFFSGAVLGACQVDGFSSSEDQVLRAYIAYYGRPADPGGLDFWADRLDSEGGSLTSIIEAFGVSQEYDDRFGNLTNTELVTNLYQQLFGREPDDAGRDFYVSSLDAGTRTLQSISLDILFGAQNEDLTTLNNRLSVSQHYVTQLKSANLENLMVPAETLAGFVSSVGSAASSATTSCTSVDSTVSNLTTELDAVTGDQTITGDFSIADTASLSVDHASDLDTVITVNGNLDCSGNVQLQDAGRTLRFNVSGDVHLGCAFTGAGSGTGNTVTVVVGGALTTSTGFKPMGNGSFIIVDDETLLMSVEDFLQDAETDDGTSPLLMQPIEDDVSAASVAAVEAGLKRPYGDGGFQSLATCNSATPHTLSGPMAPAFADQNLDQATRTDPVLLAAWFNCDVDVDGLDVTPPTWNNPPPATESSNDGSANESGSDGRNGMTMNLRTNGKMNFRGGSVLRLMAGGDGQASTVSSGPGQNATATGGDGGKGGNLKVQAGGGFNFAAGATVTIVPGRGGNGGDATATAGDGAAGCPGQNGGSATATGGKGGKNTKKLTIRGIDPSGKVFVSAIQGGQGGHATANAGKGGKGNDGNTCNGGVGGNATANGGDGGEVSFRYSGTGTVAEPDLIAGNGGNATGTNVGGGAGGNNVPNQGGDGGAGGAIQADAGKKGSGSNGANMPSDGNPTGEPGPGDGGACGLCDGSGGKGGSWVELIDGGPQNNDVFSDGTSDCACQNLIPGCTDPSATNFNSNATVDDGSCEFQTGVIPGCTNPEATNFDSSANEDDGSCVFTNMATVNVDTPVGCVNHTSPTLGGLSDLRYLFNVVIQMEPTGQPQLKSTVQGASNTVTCSTGASKILCEVPINQSGTYAYELLWDGVTLMGTTTGTFSVPFPEEPNKDNCTL